MEEMKSRRLFIRETFGRGLGLLFGGALLSGCGGGGERRDHGPDSRTDTAAGQDSVSNDVCDKRSLTAADIKARKSLGYQEKSPIREKKCKGCKLYIPASEKRTCGGCAILKGPIEPNGYCSYWAAKG